MRAYGLRLPVVLGALLLVLAALFGLQAVYAQQTMAAPLTARLEGVSGVQGTPKLEEIATGLVVDVQLGLVPDLETTYGQLESALLATPQGKAISLKVEDHRSPQLVADLRQLDFVLAQGRATGQYVVMQQQFNQESRAMGLERATVSVSPSNSRLFVTLVQGKNYLYAIMPLTLPTSSGGGAA